MKVNPYLNFNGNTEEAFKFYKSVFGGEFSGVTRFKDTPEANRVPAKDRDKIMHIALPISKDVVLMATDAVESMGHPLRIGNNFSIEIDAESKEEAQKVFEKLSKGGKVEMPLGDASWGSYYGQFVDKFGIQWMVNYTYPKGH